MLLIKYQYNISIYTKFKTKEAGWPTKYSSDLSNIIRVIFFYSQLFFNSGPKFQIVKV